MKIQNQVGSGVGSPRHLFWFDRGSGTWLPEEKVAVRIEALRFNRHIHPAESDLAVLLVAATRRSGSVNQDVCVMEDFFVAGQQLYGFDVSRLCDGNGDDEIT